ncbi:MAG TPA: hypothetical protein VFY26_18260 [Anaerolineales bacterium]|nr:hypothetical protein [Anaerolineales bacterium]
MRLGWSSKQSSQRILRVAGILFLAMLLFYIVVYWYQPFSDFWNNFFANVVPQVASLIAAVFATLIWNLYDRQDPPRRVWGWFALALWMWFGAEVAWGYLNIVAGEVSLGLPDVLWITSYLFLGLALIQQFRILSEPGSRVLWTGIAIAAAALVGLTAGIHRMITAAAETPPTPDVIVNSFYPAADLIMAVIALWLARNFMGGAFSRPWIGLLVFSFADLLYAWLEASGMYAWSLEQGNLLTTLADVAYLGSYLVLGWGVLYMWLFLKYGLLRHTDAR